MYLSDRDLEFAVKTEQLIVDPPPLEYDTTSIDLHLDSVSQAKVWDVDSYKRSKTDGSDMWLRVGKYNYRSFSRDYVRTPSSSPKDLVYKDGDQRIILKPHGFLLWQTKEVVGTPEINPQYICFINGKSSSARSGLLVHMTAPTIHAGWFGRITLEIANLGPFDLCLQEGDAICQIVVARLSSQPSNKKKAKIAIGQREVTGSSGSTT